MRAPARAVDVRSVASAGRARAGVRRGGWRSSGELRDSPPISRRGTAGSFDLKCGATCGLPRRALDMLGLFSFFPELAIRVNNSILSKS